MRAGIESEVAGRSESIEMAWTYVNNGRVPYGQKGVGGRSGGRYEGVRG